MHLFLELTIPLLFYLNAIRFKYSNKLQKNKSILKTI